jgi:hypothetical protein
VNEGSCLWNRLPSKGFKEGWANGCGTQMLGSTSSSLS